MHTFLGSKSEWHLFLACIATVVLFLTGCASAPSPLPSEELRSQLRKIRISHCTVQPEVEVNTPSGAAGGGMKGFGLGFARGLEGLQMGPVVAITCPAYAIYGMFKGVKASQPATKVEEFDKRFRASIQKTSVIDILRQSVADQINKLKVSEITAQSDQSASIIMEFAVTKIKLGDGFWIAPQNLFIIQKTRLIRAADGMELYSHSFVKKGKEYTFDEWFAMDDVKMRKEIEVITHKLSEEIVDNIFVLDQPDGKK